MGERSAVIETSAVLTNVETQGSAVVKKSKLLFSERVMLHLAEIIQENLAKWYMVFAPAGKHGKGRHIDQLVEYINSSDHALLRGKTTTSETIGIWIKNGKQLAEAEQARREEINTKGREDDSSIEPHITAWYNLICQYNVLVSNKEENMKIGSVKDICHSFRENKGQTSSLTPARLKRSRTEDDEAAEMVKKDNMVEMFSKLVAGENRLSLADQRKEKVQELNSYLSSLATHPQLSSTLLPLIEGVKEEIMAFQAEERSARTSARKVSTFEKQESIVDLRSDTVTLPTDEMRAAMLAAPLGDDVFGDDPTVLALQQKISSMLGFEEALFLPTGTQSNFCGILSHCQRGDEYIVGQMAHCYRWEGGGAAVLGSVQPQPISHQLDGTLSLEDIEAAIKPDDPHFARTRLLCLENTFGGKLLPLDYLHQATSLARSKGLGTHLDGARLFNAAVLQAQQLGSDARTEARRIARCFDTVSVCFSKGLGAPAGSALCGPRHLIDRARRIRKMAGGGMRQAGVLAAAALHALDHHVDRLAEDHALAGRLAAALHGVPGLVVAAPHTNILFVDMVGPARARCSALVAYLAQHGVKALDRLPLRFVTHLGVDAAGVDRAAALIRAFMDPPAPAPAPAAERT